MKRLLFVFNPMAGKAVIQRRLYEAVNYFTSQGYLVTLYPTQAAGDAFRFLRDLQENYDRIVVSGGDGTLNEAVSGVLTAGRQDVLGYLPLGSTNDFARSIGIPSGMHGALESAVKGEPFTIDIGKAGSRYFVYVAAFGIFTDVSYGTPQKLKNTFGHLAYILQGIKAISDLRTWHVVLEYVGTRKESDFILGMITNTMSVGGFKYPLKEGIRLNDGLFEILMIKAPQNLADLQAVIYALLNEKKDERIVWIQTSHLTIHSEPIAWTLDGEYGGTCTELEIENLHSAISISVKSRHGSVKKISDMQKTE